MNSSKYLTDNTIITSKWVPCNVLPDIFPIKKVHGLCFNIDGELLLVRKKNDSGWTIPGGTHELYETTIDTLIREADEEASVKLFCPTLIGYIADKLDILSEDKRSGYNLLYFAMVSDIYEQKKDPSAHKLRKRKFIDLEKVSSYIDIGLSGSAMMQDAFNQYKQFMKKNNF
ncbi:MAG: NUDIX hydrolase [Candidatus Woesearchaeota archaeon]